MQSAAGSGSAMPEQADALAVGAAERLGAESPDLFMPLPTSGMMQGSVAGMATSTSIPQQMLPFSAVEQVWPHSLCAPWTCPICGSCSQPHSSAAADMPG